MKSGKQRRSELDAKRAVQGIANERARSVPVNRAELAPNNSYGVPDSVERGCYLDTPFTCAECGSQEVWTAAQQKWWYEVAKGFAYSTARLCRACRRKERERRNEARRIHLEGIGRKWSRS
jgi:hypothetical protein